MAQAVRFSQVGGPEVLKLEEVTVAEPGPGEVRIRQTAIGLNFADLSLRAGLFPAPLPCCPGSEAAGIVDAVGAGVTHFKLGDRVAYGGSPPGAYVSERILPAALLAHLPDRIDSEVAAGMMSKGLTVAYLLRSLWPSLKPGDVVLLHAAAGGVGQIAAQWAKALGLIVIGTVGSKSKIAAAEQAGCDHVIVHSEEDVAARVRELTGGLGAAVVYDSIGKDTFEASLRSLRRRGLLVSFGAASGAPPPLNMMELAVKGSLYVTRPALHDFLADPAERARLTSELFEHVESGRIKVTVNQRYPLAEASRAHGELQARKTTGSTVLVP